MAAKHINPPIYIFRRFSTYEVIIPIWMDDIKMDYGNNEGFKKT